MGSRREWKFDKSWADIIRACRRRCDRSAQLAFRMTSSRIELRVIVAIHDKIRPVPGTANALDVLEGMYAF